MKLRGLLMALALIMGAVLGTVPHAHADVLWAPAESGDQTLFSFNLFPQNCTMDGALYINDTVHNEDNSTGNAVLLNIIANTTYSGTQFTIQDTAGDWNVYDSEGNFLLALGGTPEFRLYYYYAWGTDQPQIAEVTPIQWILNTPDGCLPVLITDAAPVPVPGSFLLFGSGLAGVFTFLRRFAG